MNESPIDHAVLVGLHDGKTEAPADDQGGETRSTVEEKLNQGADKMRGMFERVADRFDGTAMADRAATFARQARTASETAASAVQDAAQIAGTQAADLGSRLYDEGRRTGKSIGRAIEEQPFTSVLVAAAFGYAVACFVRRR
jgi:ElaB/YqjD/DUF883 family membrane-anchored ribosome-binding protein